MYEKQGVEILVCREDSCGDIVGELLRVCQFHRHIYGLHVDRETYMNVYRLYGNSPYWEYKDPAHFIGLRAGWGLIFTAYVALSIYALRKRPRKLMWGLMLFELWVVFWFCRCQHLLRYDPQFDYFTRWWMF